MKQNWIKALTLMLALFMLAGMLAACGGKENPPANTPTDAPTGEEVVTPEDTAYLYDSNGYLKDSLPETYEWDKNFTIYSWDDQKQWEWVDEGAEVTGIVMEALYKRQERVQDRFGVNLKLVYEHGAWANRQNFISKIAKNIQTEQGLYDLVGQYTPSAGIGAMQGLYTDLNDLNYLDLNKPWWPSLIAETSTIGDKLFFATGDITPLLIRNVHAMFVNLNMYDSMQLSELVGDRSIYEVVRDKDWTMETMQTLAVGTVGEVENTYGLIFENNVQADAFFYSNCFSLLQNTDGVIMMSDDLSGGDARENLFKTVKDLFLGTYADVGIKPQKTFVDGQAIFYVTSVGASQTFAEKEMRFSILPMPMRNKDQGAYYTCGSFWVTMYSVPVDAPSKEMSGMILEALASQAYRSVSDEIYYNLFQMRYNSDDGQDSADMFDIVSDSVVFDPARMFADELNMFAAFRNGANDAETGSWSGVFTGNKDVWAEKIEGMYDKVA